MDHLPDPASKASLQRVEDLMTFLSIPSVTGDEGKLARHLSGRLAGSGRPVVLDRDSVIIPPADDDRPLVILSGHLDTVPPRGNETPRLEGETVWGRGSADMKGGLSVIVSLLDDPKIGAGWARVGAILYAGEEGPLAQNDLGRLLDGAAKWSRDAVLAILLEPTDVQIEVGCVGLINVEAVFRGEACHSARPWFGKNAIEVALPWLESISAFEIRQHEIAGFTFRETATITTLTAGTARNVVPGELVANLNYRFPPGWDLGRARVAVSALVAGATEMRIIDEAPSAEVPLERPHFAAFVHGSGLRCRAKQAWTDVAQYSERRVPALNFGPGDPQLAHRDDEHVKISAIDRTHSTIYSFLSGASPFSGPRLVAQAGERSVEEGRDS